MGLGSLDLALSVHGTHPPSPCPLQALGGAPEACGRLGPLGYIDGRAASPSLGQVTQ